jgi:hypothetical protein
MSCLITNPRDIPRFIDELKKVNFTAIIGVNTLFNALLNCARFAQVSTQRHEVGDGRRHGRAAARLPSDGRRSPACRWSKATG